MLKIIKGLLKKNISNHHQCSLVIKREGYILVIKRNKTGRWYLGMVRERDRSHNISWLDNMHLSQKTRSPLNRENILRFTKSMILHKHPNPTRITRLCHLHLCQKICPSRVIWTGKNIILGYPEDTENLHRFIKIICFHKLKNNKLRKISH